MASILDVFNAGAQQVASSVTGAQTDIKASIEDAKSTAITAYALTNILIAIGSISLALIALKMWERKRSKRRA